LRKHAKGKPRSVARHLNAKNVAVCQRCVPRVFCNMEEEPTSGIELAAAGNVQPVAVSPRRGCRARRPRFLKRFSSSAAQQVLQNRTAGSPPQRAEPRVNVEGVGAEKCYSAAPAAEGQKRRNVPFRSRRRVDSILEWIVAAARYGRAPYTQASGEK